MRFIEQFNINNSNESHIQFVHLELNEKEFKNKIIRYIFEDKLLYKYVTNFTYERMKNIEELYPIKHLIELVKNLKKEYMMDFFPEELQKKFCFSKKICKLNDINWKIKFNEYVENNINGYDVIAEIILSKIIEEYLEADVFLTKLGLSTNTNMRVFGIDVVHYNEKQNTVFFGESKFTKNIDLGIKQHLEEICLLDYKITCESKLFATHENNIRCIDEIKYKISTFGRKLTLESCSSLINSPKNELPFDIGVVFFCFTW